MNKLKNNTHEIYIADLIYTIYIRDYIICIDGSGDYIITHKNNVLIKYDFKNIYTLTDIIDMIDTDSTKYIILSQMRKLLTNKDELFIMHDTISDSWNNIISYIKILLINNTH